MRNQPQNLATPMVVKKARSSYVPPTHWLDLNPEQRIQAVIDLGLPKFRAQQINRHVVCHVQTPVHQWSDMSEAVRTLVAEKFLPNLLSEVRTVHADRNLTAKTLWRLGDGALIESVLMRYPQRATLCVSSQAGCAMNCPFCATGQGGLQRNLSVAEILWQISDGFRRLESGEIPGGPARVSNVVFMGMGEPLANFERLLQVIQTMTTPAPTGFGMSARGITVSTVGLVPRILQLAHVGLPVTLALSLHAPNNELRNQLVPMNTHFGVEEVVQAAHQYFAQTKRRVSVEYALMRDINDSAEHANQLASLLNRHGRGWVHVNLIPLNPTPGSKWTASRKSDERQFVDILQRRGVPVTVRDSRGADIDGACGQLAAAE